MELLDLAYNSQGLTRFGFHFFAGEFLLIEPDNFLDGSGSSAKLRADCG